MILIIASFIFLVKSNTKFEELNTAKKYHSIEKMVMHESRYNGKITSEVENELGEMNFEVIKSQIEFDEILKNAHSKFRLNRDEHRKMKILEYKDFTYLDIETCENHFLLQDKNEVKSATFLIMVIFGLILLSFIFVFILTLKKLYPIKKLQEKVVSLGDEDFDFSCFENDKKDEVSLLAQEFSKSAKKLEEIKEARNVFIRNIMHELKTPITKGKFLIELPNDSENKLLMQKVFYRLESLINEFASIEELISVKNFQTKEYFLADVVDNAIDLMLNIEDKVDLMIEDEKIAVHFKLFSIAVKNLLDNGIKYSQTKRVTVNASKEKIEFINDGKPLKYQLEYYFEPFKKENTNNEGFGLGLYITNHILKAHNLEFEYRYEDEKNIFTISFLKVK
jgi:two-component system OmpR family sensor kinase